MISTPGKNLFSTSFPGNGAKDVYAKNCFQTTRKQANIISNLSIKKTGFLGFFKDFMVVKFVDKREYIHNPNKN